MRKVLRHGTDPAEHRIGSAGYPPVGEFLDAFVKERLGDPEPMRRYVERCAAVKVRFAKPLGEPHP